MPGITSPRNESIQPNCAVMMNIGMNVVAAGTIRVNTVSPSTILDSRWVKRASPYPAIREITTVPTVCRMVMIAEFNNPFNTPVESEDSIDSRLARLSWSGSQFQRGAVMFWFVEKAFRMIT